MSILLAKEYNNVMNARLAMKLRGLKTFPNFKSLQSLSLKFIWSVEKQKSTRRALATPPPLGGGGGWEQIAVERGSIHFRTDNPLPKKGLTLLYLRPPPKKNTSVAFLKRKYNPFVCVCVCVFFFFFWGGGVHVPPGSTNKAEFTLYTTRHHDTTFTQYLVCDWPISYSMRRMFNRVCTGTMQLCRVVLSCRTQCDCALIVVRTRRVFIVQFLLSLDSSNIPSLAMTNV